MRQGPLEVAYEVIEVLEDLEVPYHVGGSFASSLHGVPRQTHDLDLVVDLRPEKVPRLVHRLSDRFYVDADMLHAAIRREGSTNLLHLETGFKIDLFIRQPGPFDRSEFRRHGPQRDSPPCLVVQLPHHGAAGLREPRTLGRHRGRTAGHNVRPHR